MWSPSVARRAATSVAVDGQSTALIDATLAETLAALGVERQTAPARLTMPLLRPLARRFAAQAARYDAYVGTFGLREGARRALVDLGWVTRLDVSGLEHVPPTGPALFVSNHPGACDTVALFASIVRAADDLRIVAARRRFLDALPHTRARLITLDEEGGNPVATIRELAGALRAGGAVLTFPAGRIEPDPLVLPGASATLASWPDSLAVALRVSPPDTWIVPTVVSGALSAPAQQSPLTRLRRAAPDRERLGAMLQALVPAYRRVAVRVAFAPPLRASDLVGERPRTIQVAPVVDAVRQLMESPPASWEALIDEP